MKKLFLFFSGFTLLLVAGCARYAALPLKKLEINNIQKLNTCEQIVGFNHIVYNSESCKKYLGCDLISYGIQPIQLSIINKSNKRFIIDDSCFNLELIPVADVIKMVQKTVVGRAVGYTVSSGTFAFVGSALVFPTIMAFAYNPWFGILFIPLALFPIMLISGIGDTTTAYLYNRDLNKDYLNKSISRRIIETNSIVNGLIFVRNSKANIYSDNINKIAFTLNDIESNNAIILSNDKPIISLS